MPIDHVFICTSVAAPAAARLREFGLTEGSPNTHTGQGTACRRFFFQNAMLELIWVDSKEEALSEQSQRTKLWERWSAAGQGASPFGIILRPKKASPAVCPFKSWQYRPVTMPDLVLEVALDTGLDEPMWCFMKSGRAPAEAPPERRQPLDHAAGLVELTRVRLTCPPISPASVTAMMADAGLISLQIGEEHLLSLQFDGGLEGRSADFRPDLPLVLEW